MVEAYSKEECFAADGDFWSKRPGYHGTCTWQNKRQKFILPPPGEFEDMDK